MVKDVTEMRVLVFSDSLKLFASSFHTKTVTVFVTFEHFYVVLIVQGLAVLEFVAKVS